jgi:AcrR family transcriptional regulator
MAVAKISCLVTNLGFIVTAMKLETRKVGGRPRKFDQDAALEQAMRLFWRHGCEGASLDQLTAAMGIAPPSLYGAFGSKAELYRAALDRYGSLDLSAMRQAQTLAGAVRALLDSAIAAITDPARERGGMVSSGLNAVHPLHQPQAVETAMRRALLRTELVQALRPFLKSTRHHRSGFTCRLFSQDFPYRPAMAFRAMR